MDFGSAITGFATLGLYGRLVVDNIGKHIPAIRR
jgi:hypothetical protein